MEKPHLVHTATMYAPALCGDVWCFCAKVNLCKKIALKNFGGAASNHFENKANFIAKYKIKKFGEALGQVCPTFFLQRAALRA